MSTAGGARGRHHAHHAHRGHHGSLQDHTVVELRHMAKKAGVKQTTADGHTKNKAQLIRSLHVAGHRGAHEDKHRGRAHHY